MRKYIVYIVIIVGVITGMILISRLDKPESEPLTINIGYKKHVAYMPLFIGIEKGFYEEEGLDIKLSLVESTNQMLSAIVSGNIDASIGGANIPTILSIEEKSPNSLKLFNTLEVNENTSITCVVVERNSNIGSLTELYGAKIATLPGSFSKLWINSALETVKLSSDEVTIIELEPSLQISSLDSKQVDALFTVEPACSFAVNKGVGKIIYNEPLRHFGSSLTASVVSNKLVKNNPETVQKMVRATDKAIEFIRNNPSESLTIMAKHSGYNTESIQGMITPVYNKSTEIDVDKLQKLIDKLIAMGELNNLNASNIILD